MDKTYEYEKFKFLGGHMTGPNTDTYYSSVVSLRAMRMMIFPAELNGMDLIAADIGNAYLEAYTNEKICFIAGKNFKTMDMRVT
eukprot:9116902-Ditylum_brightwellii.AAC.1